MPVTEATKEEFEKIDKENVYLTIYVYPMENPENALMCSLRGKDDLPEPALLEAMISVKMIVDNAVENLKTNIAHEAIRHERNARAAQKKIKTQLAVMPNVAN